MQELHNLQQKYKEQSTYLEEVLAQLTVSFSNSYYFFPFAFFVYEYT